MKAIEAYDSAYPGSMSQREDGSFIRREDAESLASALLALVKSGDREAEDLKDALIQYKKDAERYMFLRRGQHWSVIDGIGDTLRADALDAAIDAAMKAPNASGKPTTEAAKPL